MLAAPIKVHSRDTLRRPESRLIGGRTLLWHAVRLGNEEAVRFLLENRRHDRLITKRDAIKHLDCCDLAILFELVVIIEYLVRALSELDSASCFACRRKQRHHAGRFDMNIQPTSFAFWFDLYQMMPLDSNDEAQIRKFTEMASVLAESESLGTRDGNGATLVWHAARMEDEHALHILLMHDQINRGLLTLDYNFHIDPLTISILAGNQRIAACLSSCMRILILKMKLSTSQHT